MRRFECTHVHKTATNLINEGEWKYFINATEELPLHEEKLFIGKQRELYSNSMKKIILFSC